MATPTTSSAAIDEAETSAAPPPRDGEFDAGDLAGMELEALLDLRLRTNLATFFDQSRLEAPATVDVISESNWRLRGSRRLLDAVSTLPSIVAYPTLFGGEVVAIRGYTPSARGVSLLLDGVPLNELQFGTALSDHANFQLPALDRIEVVRGPGSAVYGSDAFLGVLSLRTFAPDTNQSEAGAEIGTDLFHRGYARTSLAIGENLRSSSVVSYSGQPDQNYSYGYTDPSTGATGTGVRNFAYQGFHANTQLRYDPRGRPIDGSIGLYTSATAADGYPSLYRSGGVTLRDRDMSKGASQFYMARASFGADLGARVRVDVMGYGWMTHGRYQGNAPSGIGRVLAEYRYQDYRSGMRVTLKQDLLDRFHSQWLIGYELSSSVLGRTDRANFYLPIGDVPPELARSPAAGMHRTVNSLFLSAETRFASDKIRLHYGGRLDWFSDVGFVASPRAGIIVMPTQEWAFKVLYGRAFRPPTGSELRGVPHTVATSPGITSEHIGSVELVAELQREKYRVSFTAFGSKWRDTIQIESVPDPQPGEPRDVYMNGGDNSAGGLEAATAFADRGFRIDSSASLVRSRNDETGYKHSTFPTFIGNLGLGYRFSGPRIELYLFQRVLANMTEAVRSDAYPTSPKLPTFYQINLHIEWEAIRDRLDVFADFRNILFRDNRFPSVWRADDGYTAMPANVSIGLRGKL